MLEETRRVTPADVEDELAALRRSMVGHADSPATLAASVHNLVVIPRDPVGDLTATLASVIDSHPGRVIVLEGGAAEADTLEAEVAALRVHARRPAYAEYVAIEARGRPAAYLPELALPLLVSSVPTILWWAGPPPWQDPSFARLATLADRVIVDTGRSVDGLADLSHLARLSSEGGRWEGLGDLNWARLTPWRQLAAQFFDIPLTRPLLNRIDQIHVFYGTDGAPVRPLLYVGWLASRLRWELEHVARGDGVWKISYRHGARSIQVSLVADPSFADLPGAITSIRLAAHSPTPATFTVQRMDDRLCLKAEAVTGAALLGSRIVEMPELDDADLLRDEMARVYRNAVYHAALREAAAIVRQAEGEARSLRLGIGE
ncbi:MAG: glucose-6-phosphate dehydrogenase assembly protein OpcA [Anaerolineae bacterium]|nr:glucose-6-phosphate dehydrogenase assembly protein OpcA [Anaerolineae bacterium]